MGMKKIPLTQGRVVLVDDADYEWLSQWKWRIMERCQLFYAIRSTGSKHNRGFELMHRLILGLQPNNKLQTDHIDGDGLNNQRSNLRACTRTQNRQSARKRKVGTSKYKGVCCYVRNGKWHSRIRINGKLIHLGSFESETDAARAYDEAAPKHYGEFALTNAMLGLL